MRRRARVGLQELVIGRDNLARRFEASTLAKERADVVLLGNRSRNADPQGWATYTTATLPTAAAAYHHRIVWLKDVSAPEQALACMQNSDGSYAWTVIAFAPL